MLYEVITLFGLELNIVDGKLDHPSLTRILRLLHVQMLFSNDCLVLAYLTTNATLGATVFNDLGNLSYNFV